MSRAKQAWMDRPTSSSSPSFEGGSSGKWKGRGAVGLRESDERKWAAEWKRLEQRRKMVENDMLTTGARKAKYASNPASKHFWESVLVHSSDIKQMIQNEKKKLLKALSDAHQGVHRFTQEMKILRTENGKRPETVKRVRLAMEGIEDLLLEFKRRERTTYEDMISEERALSKDLEKALEKAEARANNQGSGATEKNQTAMQAKSPNHVHADSDHVAKSPRKRGKDADDNLSNPTEDGEQTELKQRLADIDAEIQENGGEQGHWSDEDHKMYLNIKKQKPNVNAMLQRAAEVIPLQDLYSVSAHHAWHLRYKQLLREKKELVAQWKKIRMEEAVKAFNMVQMVSERKQLVEQRKKQAFEKEQREKAIKVKRWREEKRKKEIQTAEAKRKKEKKIAQRKARLFLEATERQKAKFLVQKKLREEEEMSKKIEEEHVNKTLLKVQERIKKERRERVLARNKMETEKRAMKIRAKQQEKKNAELRMKKMLSEARSDLRVESKFQDKTKAQKEREKRTAFLRRHGGFEIEPINSRPAYLGVGRATPAWMR